MYVCLYVYIQQAALTLGNIHVVPASSDGVKRIEWI